MLYCMSVCSSTHCSMYVLGVSLNVSVLTKSLQIQINNYHISDGNPYSIPAATLPLFNANQPQTCSSLEFFLLFSFVLLKHGVMASNIVQAWNSRNSLARWQLAHGTSSRCCACWSHLIQIHSALSIKGFLGSSSAL